MAKYRLPESKQLWDDFLLTKQTALDNCAKHIGREFESEFGVEAIHTGVFPNDWVKPGGF
jgi:hypothetical protein